MTPSVLHSSADSAAILERIRPYYDEEVPKVIESLKKKPEFNRFLQMLPQDLVDKILEKSEDFHSVDDFKKEVLSPLLRFLLKKTAFSYDLSGTGNLKGLKASTFLSNHRDIILDSAILNLCLLESDLPLCRIAIGDNLLASPLITTLVKLADGIIVERDLPPRDFMASSRVFSAFIDKSIHQDSKSVWIAHREGRAKDSDDRTQPSLLKMLAFSGEGSFQENLLAKNIIPMAISYEYDPCDYLKAKELLARRSGRRYTKTSDEDLNSMRQGLWGQKGRIHIDLGTPLCRLISENERDNTAISAASRRNDYFVWVAQLIDKEIHSRYRLYPGNYVAEDMLSGELKRLQGGHYSEADAERFRAYLEGQLELANPADAEERQLLRELILLQYANPLRNFQKTSQREFL